MTMLSDIPANIITGFLGSGKTTAIRHLLQGRPEGERWAVLVNEFGETGVDGALLDDRTDNISIREVPGGCMCCAAGVPMQVALNQLLARARPHRLLIEPTGLGHPGALIRTLTGEHLAPVLDLRAVLTLVDARKLADERYTDHRVFRQQLEVADRIIASKADLYEEPDRNRLAAFLDGDPDLRDRPRHFTEQGRLDPVWLDTGCHGKRMPTATMTPGTQIPEPETGPSTEEVLPASGFIQTWNEGQGYASAGWRFRADFVFERAPLERLIRRHPARRIKGVVNTGEGRLRINRDDDTLALEPVEGGGESRLEFIADEAATLSELENRLRACLRD